ncbi:hypothetical protein [Dietzia kunjamensis]|uniref:hypothetical protein n=1 Tax=Dietzia kunjamensis TaxID=322509 RepID=UPI002097ED61|nr:hypothetical protein [Dietzia kunjamensis]USX45183.1 hypothetical protein NHB83_13165 [Dietzia kunjamensis]
MTSRTRRAWIVAATTVLGALTGAGAGTALADAPARYASTATVAVVPAAGLPDDLAADFWQVLSEEQVVRTAATIYGSEQWAVEAARALDVPTTEVVLSASALVDTTLVEVTVETGSAASSDAALATVLGSASTSASTILAPFVISEAAVRPAETARGASPAQLVGVAAIAGALVGAGIGLVISAIGRRGRDDGRGESGGGGAGGAGGGATAGGDGGADEGVGTPGADRGTPGTGGDDDEVGRGPDQWRPADDLAHASTRESAAGRHAAGQGPAAGMGPP